MSEIIIKDKIGDFSNIFAHVDGGCEPKNPGGITTSGWVIYNSKKPNDIIAQQGKVVQTGGALATNNYGEYMSLVLLLEWLLSQNWKGNIKVFADSKLLVEQVSNKWKVKAEHLKPLKEKIHVLLSQLDLKLNNNFEISWIPREKNSYPDNLCRLAYLEYTNS